MDEMPRDGWTGVIRGKPAVGQAAERTPQDAAWPTSRPSPR